MHKERYVNINSLSSLPVEPCAGQASPPPSIFGRRRQFVGAAADFWWSARRLR